MSQTMRLESVGWPKVLNSIRRMGAYLFGSNMDTGILLGSTFSESGSGPGEHSMASVQSADEGETDAWSASCGVGLPARQDITDIDGDSPRDLWERAST